MPMVERCTDLSGQEGFPGYTQLVSGFMFPQPDGERSWIEERLVSMDLVSHTYVYKMEASNVGLDGSTNSLRLIDYGEDSTLVKWLFKVSPVEGSTEENIVDYLGFLYRSCINRIEAAIEAMATKERSVTDVLSFLYIPCLMNELVLLFSFPGLLNI